MNRLSNTMVALVVLVLLAAGCGDSGGEGDGDGDGNGGADTTQVTSAPAATGDTPDTVIDFGTIIEDIPGVDDECIAVANVFGYLAQASFALSGQADIDIPGAEQQFAEAAAQLPGDLQDDIAVLADGLLAFYEAIDDAGIDLTDPNAAPDPAQFAALESALEEIDTPEFQAAGEALGDYANEQCAGLTE